jgi:hypothetical protein
MRGGGIGGWRVRLVSRFMLSPRFGRSGVNGRTVDFGSRRLDAVQKYEGVFLFQIPPGGVEK